MAATVVAVLAAVGRLYTQSPHYLASAAVQIAQPSVSTDPAQTAGAVGPNLQLVTSDEVAGAAAATLHRKDPGTIGAQTSSAYDSTTNVVTVTVTTPDPSSGPATANAVAAAYIGALSNEAAQRLDGLREQEAKLSSQIDSLNGRIAGRQADDVLRTQLSTATSLYSSLQSEILQDEIAPSPGSLLRAATASSATTESKADVLAIALAIGLLAGCGIALLRDQFDNRVRTAEAVERIGDRPVLSQLPYVRSFRRGLSALPVVTEPRNPFAESIRELRTSAAVLLDNGRTPVVVVTSPAPFDGKTLAAANLAASWALSGKRTILVSGDLRRPRIQEFFVGVDHGAGLADLISGRHVSGEEVLPLLRPTQIDGLQFLPSGSPKGDPADGLASNAMVRAVEAMRAAADIVIIDAPPVLAVADAAIIATHADGVLVVVRAGRTKNHELAEATKRLRVGGATILGFALNRVKGLVGSAYGEYYQAARVDGTTDDEATTGRSDLTPTGDSVAEDRAAEDRSAPVMARRVAQDEHTDASRRISLS